MNDFETFVPEWPMLFEQKDVEQYEEILKEFWKKQSEKHEMYY